MLKYTMSTHYVNPVYVNGCRKTPGLGFASKHDVWVFTSFWTRDQVITGNSEEIFNSRSANSLELRTNGEDSKPNPSHT